jgi:hypothetical protein
MSLFERSAQINPAPGYRPKDQETRSGRGPGWTWRLEIAMVFRRRESRTQVDAKARRLSKLNSGARDLI